MTTYPDDVYSCEDAARILGITAGRVRRIVQNRGLGQQIGTYVAGATRRGYVWVDLAAEERIAV